MNHFNWWYKSEIGKQFRFFSYNKFKGHHSRCPLPSKSYQKPPQPKPPPKPPNPNNNKIQIGHQAPPPKPPPNPPQPPQFQPGLTRLPQQPLLQQPPQLLHLQHLLDIVNQLLFFSLIYCILKNRNLFYIKKLLHN